MDDNRIIEDLEIRIKELEKKMKRVDCILKNYGMHGIEKNTNEVIYVGEFYSRRFDFD